MFGASAAPSCSMLQGWLFRAESQNFRDLMAIMDFELTENVRKVEFDGAFANLEDGADLFIGKPALEQFNYF